MTLTAKHTTGKLPASWRWVRLGEVCKRIDYGYTASADVGIKLPKFLRITDIQYGTVNWDNVPGCAISDGDEDAKRLKDGDIVFARTGATTGKSYLVSNPPRSVFASYLIRVTSHREHVEPDYLFSFFQSDGYWAQISAGARGGAQPGFNATMLATLKLPLPPLAEQRRIAAVLREQMAAVDKARAAAEERQTAAEALRAAYLGEVFDAPRATKWESRLLGDILIPYKEIIHPGDRESGTAEFVGLEHLEPHTGRRLGSLTLNLAQLTGRKPKFRRGQIVYGYLRPYLNKVWIAEFDGCSSVDQFAFDVRSDLTDVRFVAWFMRSPTYQRRSAIVTTTGQLPRIGTEEIAAVEIGLPPLDQQRAIADEMDRWFTARQRLSDSLGAEADAIDRLPAALLHRAFGGEI